MSYKEKARAIFKSGYNCAQAVFLAFTDIMEIDEKTATKLSSSFGGGMGRLREVCGAVSGCFMVLGTVLGSDDPTDHDAKMKHYAIIQEAERLRQQMEQAQTASEQKPSQEAEAPSGETSADTSANPTLANENTSSATSYSVRLPSEYLLSSTVRLFHQVGQIFRDNAAPPSNPMGIRIDSKRRKKLMQKRLAMGHKQDDHEQNYGQTLQ